MRRSSVVRRALPRAWQAHAASARDRRTDQDTHVSLGNRCYGASTGVCAARSSGKRLLYLGIISIASRRNRAAVAVAPAGARQYRGLLATAKRPRSAAAATPPTVAACDTTTGTTPPTSTCSSLPPRLRQSGDASSCCYAAISHRARHRFATPRDGWDHITIGLRIGSSRVTFPSDYRQTKWQQNNTRRQERERSAQEQSARSPCMPLRKVVNCH